MNEIGAMVGSLAAFYFAHSTPAERERFAEHLLVMFGLVDVPDVPEEPVRMAPDFNARLLAFRTKVRAELAANALGPPEEPGAGYFLGDDEPTLVTGEMPEEFRQGGHGRKV